MSLNRNILFIGVDGGDRSYNTITVTGQSKFASGTSAFPGIAFASDLTTGLYLSSTSVLGVTAAGVSVATFSSTGMALPSTATNGLQIYNTADQVTNYDRGFLKFSSNRLVLGTDKGGTGTVRDIQVGGAVGGTTGKLIMGADGSAAIPAYTFGDNTNIGLYLYTGAGNGLGVTNGTNTQTSGTTAALVVSSTYNQASGNAANTDLLISRTQTLVGSGNQLLIDAQVNTTSQWALGNNGRYTRYGGVTLAGWGQPAIYASARSTAQTAAVASVATYTCGTSDGSFMVSANVNLTASTTNSFTVTCTYSDENNTARTETFSFTQAGVATPIQTITNVTGVGAYASQPLYIRCKASTAITIATTGTFTSVTYNVEGSIVQMA